MRDGRYVFVRPDAPPGLDPATLQLISDEERRELQQRLAATVAAIRAQHAGLDMDVSLDGGRSWTEEWRLDAGGEQDA